MLCVTTAWMRFGTPEGLFDDIERVHGIHGGDVETSLMLHFRPDLVRQERAENFVASSIAMENEFALLRPTDSAVLTGDAGRLRERLGWAPTMGFREMVEAMVDADVAELRSA